MNEQQDVLMLFNSIYHRHKKITFHAIVGGIGLKKLGKEK